MRLGRTVIKKYETEMNIYNSAMKLFKENGYDNTTIIEICKSAGISKSTLFNYYRSKEDILLKYGKELRKKLIKFNSELPSDLDVQTRIARLLISDYKNNELLKEIGSFQYKEVIKRDWIYLKDEEVRKKNIEFYAHILKKGQENGQINKCLDCSTIAEIIVAVYFNKLNLIINLEHDFNYEEYVYEMLEIIWSGIK
ncbi:MAG: TetR/AcrR family transcriptional regulator [Eubacteriales bacterium]